MRKEDVLRLHERFEWVETKAVSNLAKHRISFDDAQVVLSDEQGDLFHIEAYDDQHSAGEDRFVTAGSDPFKRSRILGICWTQRQDQHARFTRIISARAATEHERKAYAAQIGGTC